LEDFMPTNRERLLTLIRERAYTPGEVTLSSGAKSDFYIDGKMLEVSPEGAHLIGEALYELIEGLGTPIDAVGGLAVGAVPLVTSAVISCYHHGRQIEGFFVRAEAKEHGTRKTIEGRLPDQARVVIVDDVVTSGKSVMQALEAARQRGAAIVAVLAIVDREAGAKEFFARQGIRYEAVFTRRDVVRN
jgi:orotate phosphoribosyltransferase